MAGNLRDPVGKMEEYGEKALEGGVYEERGPGGRAGGGQWRGVGKLGGGDSGSGGRGKSRG